MIALGFTGLLSIVVAVTLVLLLFVILQKERPEDADKLDRTLLTLAFICLGIATAMSGFFVMAGAASGIATAQLTVPILVNNALKLGFIVFGWIKIIRNTINNRRMKRNK